MSVDIPWVKRPALCIKVAVSPGRIIRSSAKASQKQGRDFNEQPSRCYRVVMLNAYVIVHRILLVTAVLQNRNCVCVCVCVCETMLNKY